MEPLSFRIPEQHPPGDEGFDLRPAAIRSWVEELPLANTGVAAQRIYKAVREVNALAVPLDGRLELLEVLAEPLDSVLAVMEQQFSDKHFPMPAKSLRLAGVTNQLLAQVVVGYQAVLTDWERSSWLFRKTHSSLWTLALHRLIHYLGRILSNYRQIHRPYPAGVWLAVHRLLFKADQQGRTAEKVELSWANGRSETIAEAYKRTLLCALLEPQLFTRPQMEEVARLMPLLQREAALLAPEKWREGMESYCIRLDQDAPHTVQAEQCQGDKENKVPGMMLDISDLGALLDEALMSDAEKLVLSGIGAEIARETAAVLRQCWQVSSGPRAERYKSDLKVETALGLSAIFSLMRGMSRRRRDGITDQLMNDELLPLLPKRGAAKRGDPVPSQGEVWDTIFYGTAVLPNSWAMGEDENNYRFVAARELNYNERGYCLEFARDAVQVLDVGELVGIRDNERDALQLCEVRWLQEDEHSLLVGLMRLASEMEPVLVLMTQEQRDTALGCLLGIGEDMHPQLFLPHLHALDERPLQIVVDKRTIPIALKEQVSVSPLFAGYHLCVADEVELLETESLDEVMSLKQANSLLHRIAHSDEEPQEPKAKDDFSDLWDSL